MLAGCWGPRGSDKCQLIAIEEFNQEEKQAREKEEKEINGAHLVASRFDDSLIVWQVFVGIYSVEEEEL